MVTSNVLFLTVSRRFFKKFVASARSADLSHGELLLGKNHYNYSRPKKPRKPSLKSLSAACSVVLIDATAISIDALLIPRDACPQASGLFCGANSKFCPIQSIRLTCVCRNAESNRRSRRVSGPAPLVDSALLRFVSAEKQKQQQLGSTLSDDSLSSIYGSDEINTDATSTQADGTAALPAIRDQMEQNPWMGQYNRNRIARTLESLGVSEPLASKAGEKVQDYVLVRMARRRVRLFLKERDSLWRDSGVGQSKLRDINCMFTDEPSHLNYGFDDVVNVLQENGLTGTDICTILTHSPSLALMMPKVSFADDPESLSGETLEQTLDRSLGGTLMTTLGLRKYDARKVLRNCPGLLTARGSRCAEKVVSMMTHMGVSTSAIARDKTALPTLLSRSPADLFRLVSFLSSGSIRMKIECIGPMLRRKSSFELLELVAPVSSVQQSKEVADEDDAEIELTLEGKTREERKKRIDDVYKNMTMTANALRYEIGARDLGKVIASYPSVLLLNAEEKILPTASFLMNELGIAGRGLASALQLYPVLLNEDIEEMEKVVSYLEAVGVKDEDLPSIFRSFPALLTSNIERDMIPVVEYLRSIGINDIGSFITKLPPVLGYSVEKELQPKWEYLKRVCFKPEFELEQFPAYFSYPFERVIKTRYEYLATKDVARQLIPVAKVLRFGDKDFARVVARDRDGGKAFRAFCEKRRRGIQGSVQKRKPKSKKPNRPPKKPATSS
eukprot:scaffold3103_cov136-Cylindrotheca_fusiformis.AAC.21